jgi:hypothetical protein
MNPELKDLFNYRLHTSMVVNILVVIGAMLNEVLLTHVLPQRLLNGKVHKWQSSNHCR